VPSRSEAAVATVALHEACAGDWSRAVAADVGRSGVAAATGVFDPDAVAAMAARLDEVVERDAAWIPPDRLAHERGRVLFLGSYGPPFLSLLDDGPLYEPVDELLGAGSTLYTMTSACTPPGGGPRALHQDSPLVIDGFTVGLGIMVLLDDFDEANGATRFHPVISPTPPQPDAMERESLRLVAPAGSVCWFHGAAWHDTTRNRSTSARRCIILAAIRPFVRQRFDMARMVGHLPPDQLTPARRRRLGLHLQPPGSYEEYYLPADERERCLTEAARERSSAAP
jgi:hypothetical protein